MALSDLVMTKVCNGFQKRAKYAQILIPSNSAEKGQSSWVGRRQSVFY